MKRRTKIVLGLFGASAVAGAGIAAAWALQRQALPPAPPPRPLPPASAPVPDSAIDEVERLLAFEAKNPAQYWYNRGFDGETLGIVPMPTDVWFALGQREKAAGLARRDVRAQPPTAADWAQAGITRLVVAAAPLPRP